MLRIDRCVCQRTLFATLLPLAREHNWDLAAIMEETGCGDQCGMCRPYLRAMLSEGTTIFTQIMPLTEEDN